MFSHMKNVVSRVTHALGTRNEESTSQQQTKDSSFGRLTSPLIYQRPLFLDLSDEDKQQVLNHKTRCPCVPKNSSSLPFNSGYCEVINAGKSTLNEDCAVALTTVIESHLVESCNCQLSNKDAEDTVNETPRKDLCEESTDASPDKNENKETSDDCVAGDPSVMSKEQDAPQSEITLDKPNPQHVGDAEQVLRETETKTLSNEPMGDSQCQPTKAPADCEGSQNLDGNMNTVYEFQETKSISYHRCKAASLRVDYFAIFDGHAGEGAALYASSVLHEILIERFREIQHLLKRETSSNQFLPACLSDEPGSMSDAPLTNLLPDSLITGLLQDVMSLTDQHLKADLDEYKIVGGCTALLVVFVIGKMFVAGAGDCRAVLCRSVPVQDENNDIGSVNDDTKILALPLSQDFTPLTERRRLQYLAYVKPSLLGAHFTRYEFVQRLTLEDVGKKILHRDYHMTGCGNTTFLFNPFSSFVQVTTNSPGLSRIRPIFVFGTNRTTWSYKTVTEDDVRIPMISGNGKSKRLLATIGVTRGLGDHNLRALNHLQDVLVKPFMSSVPEVRAYELTTRSHGPNDVVIMASDGLWDVITNEMAARVATTTLQTLDEDDPNRYNKVAEKLAVMARGELTDGFWKMACGRRASPDDISVFVIPLLTASKTHS